MLKVAEHKKGKSPILQERDFPLSDSKHLNRVEQQPRESTLRRSSLTSEDYQSFRNPVNMNRKQTRINPDSRTMLWLTVGLVLSLGLCSFMVSFNGLHDVAAWVGLPGWLRWTVPIFIDIAILAYSMAVVIHRSRGERVALTWLTLGAFTCVSVIANAAHALAVGQGQTVVQSWIGAAIAAAAPLGVFAATEELSRLAFGTDDYLPRLGAVGGDGGFVPQEPLVEQDRSPVEAVDDEGMLLGMAGSLSELESQVGEVASSEEVARSVVASEDFPAEQSVSESEIPQSSVSGLVSASDSVDSGDEWQVLREWIRERIDAGEKITGAGVGELIGKSARTGLNRLNALRESEPELFVGEK